MTLKFETKSLSHFKSVCYKWVRRLVMSPLSRWNQVWLQETGSQQLYKDPLRREVSKLLNRTYTRSWIRLRKTVTAVYFSPAFFRSQTRWYTLRNTTSWSPALNSWKGTQHRPSTNRPIRLTKWRPNPSQSAPKGTAKILPEPAWNPRDSNSPEWPPNNVLRIIIVNWTKWLKIKISNSQIMAKKQAWRRRTSSTIRGPGNG